MTKNIHGLQRITRMKSIIEHRFVQPEPNSGCWLWTGNQVQGGYGLAKVGNKTELVHRAAMRLAGKPVPRHLQACHRCNVPSCCNPEHLYAGTALDNAADRKRAGKPYGRMRRA